MDFDHTHLPLLFQTYPIPPHCIMKIEMIVGQDTINSHVLNFHSLSTSNLLVKQCRCDNWFAAPHLYVTNVPLL